MSGWCCTPRRTGSTCPATGRRSTRSGFSPRWARRADCWCAATTSTTGTAAPADRDRIHDVSAHLRVEDLYLAADVLVTDYSSAMFDYAVLDRPIVVYAPDWDAYRLARGVYFDVTAEPPGAVARTFAELLDIFASDAVADDGAERARARFRARFCALDDGHAAERVVRRVFLTDEGRFALV